MFFHVNVKGIVRDDVGVVEGRQNFEVLHQIFDVLFLDNKYFHCKKFSIFSFHTFVDNPIRPFPNFSKKFVFLAENLHNLTFLFFFSSIRTGNCAFRIRTFLFAKAEFLLDEMMIMPNNFYLFERCSYAEDVLISFEFGAWLFMHFYFLFPLI